MNSFADARTAMVDTQIRPSDVTLYPIIDAMLHVAREEFMPRAYRQVAYADLQVPLGNGRAMPEPRTVGKMLDLLNVQPTELVLHVGAGHGYVSALLSRLAEAVVAIEQDPDMAAEAQGLLLAEGADNVAAFQADLAAGAPEHGPYDAVLIEGGVEVVPQALIDQLKPGGRLVAIRVQGALCHCDLAVRNGDTLAWRRGFDVSAPVLPGFAAPREFAF